MKKNWLAALVLLVALVGVVFLNPVSAEAASTQATTTSKSIPVTGTIANGVGTFTGTLTITKFATQNGQLVALGTLSGTLTNASNQVIGTVNQAVTVPVSAQATCQILNLTLGPLDLNLLGLMVHLNQVVLTITAQQGPGNLLGNLLCAVANLLNNGSPLNGIVALLNQILGIAGL